MASMAHNTSIRLAHPQTGRPAVLGQTTMFLDEVNSSCNGPPSGRSHSPMHLNKSLVSAAVPPTSAEALEGASTSPVSKSYLRRHHHHDSLDDDDVDAEVRTSALKSWLAGILCIPSAGSVRTSRKHSISPIDSGDAANFVGTWQRAQVEAAARKLAPALKRSQEAPSSPSLTSSSRSLPSRESTTSVPCMSPLSRTTSVRSPTDIIVLEVRGGRATSGPGSIPRTSTGGNSCRTSGAGTIYRTSGAGSSYHTLSCGEASGAAAPSVHLVRCLQEMNASQDMNRGGSRRNVRFG